MVIDSSAILAILQREDEADLFRLEIESAEIRLLSSVSFLEIGMIVESRTGAAGIKILDDFLDQGGIDISVFDQQQARIARSAFRRYGKGRHPARLNIGDCAVYALSKISGEPLLCKGNDFRQTDAVLHHPTIS